VLEPLGQVGGHVVRASFPFHRFAPRGKKVTVFGDQRIKFFAIQVKVLRRLNESFGASRNAQYSVSQFEDDPDWRMFGHE
jgi:hypothetical protein